MESEGGLSASRRSVGSGRGEWTSSETQGFFAAKVGNERDGVASKCHCRVYAILYLSRTVNNPNGLFFGCPFFKMSPSVRLNHCKFLLWLDQQVTKFAGVADAMGAKEANEDCR
ncbi:hypothetical protein PIB30_057790 [Stylosanthes scabra]|uniref:Zinc finger GRF-type domain-containing protein n=1 Tax=Stylosanthes scabra TaxID=79078 RepID=A0ABU6UM56_9FABA|nr:hypothetical protein [Stylosanthes scabra]